MVDVITFSKGELFSSRSAPNRDNVFLLMNHEANYTLSWALHMELCEAMRHLTRFDSR